MRKENRILFAAVVLFVIALCLCSGIDRNIWQAFIALPLMGAAAWLFNVHDNLTSHKSGSKQTSIGSIYKDAA